MTRTDTRTDTITGTGTTTKRLITSEQLKSIGLFYDVSEAELKYFREHIPYDILDYEKDDTVIQSGQYMDSVAVLLSGNVNNTRTSLEGKSYINKTYDPGDIIGIAACSTLKKTASYTIVASEKSSLLWINHEKLTHLTEHPSALVRKIHVNIERILAEEIFQKDVLCEILTKFTVREKLITYFGIVAEKRGSRSIRLSMTQTQLANYLSVSRPTLSAEMNKLRKEGLLDYRGKDITIL